MRIPDSDGTITVTRTCSETGMFTVSVSVYSCAVQFANLNVPGGSEVVTMQSFEFPPNPFKTNVMVSPIRSSICGSTSILMPVGAPATFGVKSTQAPKYSSGPKAPIGTGD